MDDLDAKLIQERDRLVAMLTGLAHALSALPAERLADVLPMLAGLNESAQRVQQSLPYSEQATPLGGASIVRDSRFAGARASAVMAVAVSTAYALSESVARDVGPMADWLNDLAVYVQMLRTF